MSFEPDVDFVLPWVDGNDPAWLEQFNQYASVSSGDKKKYRFRDWDNLQYIFRGFEFFTDWVRKIHFVTWGHLPPWLKIDHPKLNIVRHQDFLPEEILPIFSSHPIEINLHRIPGLSEKFVYFNDDTFLLKQLKKERFFKKDLPRDLLSFSIISISPIAHIKINNIQAVNRNFEKKIVIRDNFFKIFCFKYKIIDLLKSSILVPWPSITAFFDPHQPQPFLKSTFDKVWESESGILTQTTKAKFRSSNDVNQYLFRYWQLVSGNFIPISLKNTFAKAIYDYDSLEILLDKVNSDRYEMICINDIIDDDNFFNIAKNEVNHALNKILPQKSSFEV